MQIHYKDIYSIFGRLPAAMVRQRRWIVIAYVVISTFMAVGINRNFELDITLEAWFEKGSPVFELRNDYRRQFGSDENVFIAYRPGSGDVFSEDALRKLAELHREIEQKRYQDDALGKHLSHIVEMDSLFNARYQIAEGDTLVSRKLIGSDFPESPAEREKRRSIALTQDGFKRLFFSNDFQYGGIQIKTDLGPMPVEPALLGDFSDPGDLLAEEAFSIAGAEAISLAATSADFTKVDQLEYKRFLQALQTVVSQEKYKDFEFHFVGIPVTNSYMLDSMAECASLIALMVLIFVVLLWLLFGSLSAVVWPILIVVTGTFWATGLGCWFGVSYTAMWMLTLMLALAVGVASSVHVLSAYLIFRREQKSHQEALSLGYRKTGAPIFLTSITTMIGMLALTVSDMPSIQVFGYISSAAVGIVFVLVMALLPVLLHYWHPEGRAVSAQRRGLKIDLQPVMNWIAAFTKRHGRTIIVVYTLVFAFLLVGAFEIKVDSNDSKLYRDDTPLSIALNLVDQEMMGGMSLEIFLRFDQKDALKDPSVLQRISDLQHHIITNYSDKVVKAFSVADIVEDTNQVMHQGDAQYHRIPQDPQLASQLLYLFGNADPESRRDIVSDDYRSSHITLLMRNEGTHEYTAFLKRLEGDLLTFFGPLAAAYPGVDIQITGSFKLMMVLADEIIRTQLKSFSTALLIITLVLMFALGSLQSGLMAAVPNLLPAVVTFGLMGWMDIPMDGNSLLIAPVIIGIAVDDTIHFLSHYRHSWIEHGDVDIAVTQTLREVGQAVTFTSLILGLGFGVLAFAEFLGMAKPGFFGFIAILVALLSDLFFLPALIHWLKPDIGRKRFLAAALQR